MIDLIEGRDRKRAEEALPGSEQNFRLIVESIPGFVCTTTAAGEIEFVNGRILDYLGKTFEESKDWRRTLLHEDDCERVIETWSRSVATGEPYDIEHRVRRFDGVFRWFQTRVLPVRDTDGRIIRWYSLHTDIDDRKKAEEELRRSEAYLAEAQKLSRTGSFGWNVSTGEIIWSKETYCILGYDLAMKPNLDLVLERVHPEDRTLVQQMIGRATRDGTDLDFEHRLFMPGGALKHVQVVARATKADSGAIMFVGAVMDITERKRAAEALRASEHLARGQLDALTHTLDSLAAESDPDKLLEHVLRTIVEQTGASSVSAWQRNEDGGWLDLIAVIESGRFQTRKDAVHPAARVPMLAQSHPVWSEVFRTRQHAVLEDIDQRCARSRVGSDPDAVWHKVMEDGHSEPALLLLKKHLQGLGVRAVLFVPMLIAGRVTGIIGVRFPRKRAFQKEEIELTRALAHQAMLAIQLMRMSEQSRQAAVVAERNRMSRDIHDTLAQGFTGVIMQLEAVKGAIAQNNLTEVTDRVERAGVLARVGLGEARRSVLALRPRSLQDTSLCMALDDLFKRMTNGSGLQAEFHLEGDEPVMPAEWEEGLLRVAQESLTNTIKHAKAKNFRATLIIGATETQFRLVDDGAGFDLHAEHEGFGLVGMKERVDQIGGQFILRSMPGQGTEIQIILNNPAKAKPNYSGEDGTANLR